MPTRVTTKTVMAYPEPWTDEQEMEDTCCVAVTPPPCKEIVEPWGGYTSKEVAEKLGIEIDDNGLDQNGYPTRIKLIRPSSGECGKQITKYILQQESCCDGVQELVWDSESSPEVSVPNSGFLAVVTGGKAVYVWNLYGTGVKFDNSKKEIETSTPYVWVTTEDSFCGSVIITCRDVCDGYAEGYVRSTVGQWVQVSSGYDKPCIFTAISDDYPGHGDTVYDIVKGMYRLYEYQYQYGVAGGSLGQVLTFCNESGCPSSHSPACVGHKEGGGFVKYCDYCWWQKLSDTLYKAYADYVYIRIFYKWQC